MSVRSCVPVPDWCARKRSMLTHPLLLASFLPACTSGQARPPAGNIPETRFRLCAPNPRAHGTGLPAGFSFLIQQADDRYPAQGPFPRLGTGHPADDQCFTHSAGRRPAGGSGTVFPSIRRPYLTSSSFLIQQADDRYPALGPFPRTGYRSPR